MGARTVFGNDRVMCRIALIVGLSTALLMPLAAQTPLPGPPMATAPRPANAANPVAIRSCPAADSVFGKPRKFGSDLVQALRRSTETFVMVGGPRPGMMMGENEGIQDLEGTLTITDPPTPDPKYEFVISLRERHELPIDERQLAFMVDDTASVSIGSMSMHVDTFPMTPGVLTVNLYTVLQPDVFRRLAGARQIEMTLGSQKLKWDSRQRDGIAAAYAAAVCGVPPQ